MRFRTFALAVAALTLSAETHIQPAVQPGGDIPSKFRPAVPPIPKGGDIPKGFKAPRAEFQYVRREAIIPMRDGAKLYTVLIIPEDRRRRCQVPDHARSHALFGGKGNFAQRPSGPWPENILSQAYAELVRAGYIVAVQDVRGKYRSEGEYVMNRPFADRSIQPRSIIRPTLTIRLIGW